LGGEPGKSLKICLTGEKVGIWKDFATGESGNNLLDLLSKVRCGDFGAACKEAANWLNDPERYEIKPPRIHPSTERVTIAHHPSPVATKDTATQASQFL
jgi:twinkle protein